jgi:hypothetical protein
VDGAQVVVLKKTNHVSLRIFLESLDSRGLGVEVRHEQGDQMIGKTTKFLGKVAQIVTYPKSAKISTSRPNLKVRNIYHKFLLNP